MIDFTTVAIYKPLPEISTLNYENSKLLEANQALKKIIAWLIGGVMVYLIYSATKQVKVHSMKEEV